MKGLDVNLFLLILEPELLVAYGHTIQSTFHWPLWGYEDWKDTFGQI